MMNERGGVLKYVLIVLLVVAAVLAGLIYLGVQYNKGLRDNAEAFFQYLRENKAEAAYALTSKNFKQATSLEELKKRSSGMDKIDIEWGDSHRAGPDMKSIDVTLILPDKTKAPLSLTMIREGGAWKVQAADPRKLKIVKEVREEDPERLPGYSWIINWSTAKITEAFLTGELADNPAARTDVFPQDVKNIFCLIRVAYASDNTDISSQWVFLGGPKSKLNNYVIATDTIQTKGYNNLHFVLSRPDKKFPVGDYIIKLFVNGKKRKEIPFKIK